MGKTIAIGGGEIGRPGYPVETTEIDKEIISLSGKKSPKLLFIPTASGDSDGYMDTVENHFGKELGCNVHYLCIIKENLSTDEIRDEIFSSDIIYVGGGNTLKMMKLWRKLGVDKLLLEAYNKGIVLAGLSAGSICWFKYGSSDSMKFANSNADFIKVTGLGLINALHCPHYDVELNRKPNVKELMKKTSGIAIAVDNCCAIEIVDEKYRIISSKDTANAYKVYWKNGKFFEEIIEKDEDFRDIAELLTK